MVVLAIIGIITAVTITSQSSFNKTLILSNTAYDIALTIRSAETFGISSRASGSITNAGYGVHFMQGTTDSFILFADTTGGTSCAGMTPDCKPGDSIYNGADTAVQTYTLGNGMTISDFCALSSNKWSCANDGTCHGNGNCYGTRISSLDIVFTRPNANPNMNMTSNGNTFSPATTACFVIASPSAPTGPYRYIKVESSGAITANALSCP